MDAHLNSAAALGRHFASAIGLPRHGELLGLLHDLGKFSAAFQRRIKYNDLERVDHSSAGAQFAWQALSSMGDPALLSGQLLALCIASHHGGIIDCITPEGDDGFGARVSKRDEDTHLAEVLRNAAPLAAHAARLLADPQLPQELLVILRRIHATERSRHAEGHNARAKFSAALLARTLFSCLIDADHTDTAAFERPDSGVIRLNQECPQWSVLIDRLEAHILGLTDSSEVGAVRRSVSDACREAAARERGLFTLSVPTGGGKTLSSLRFALHHAKNWSCSRIVYVAPFTSILDQNAQVARDILEPPGADFASVVLEHHSNLTREESTWRAKLLSENWNAPIVFTTMVRFLEALFGQGTSAARRLHRLADAVIICDEIQTLPVTIVHPFCNALNFLVAQCGATVVLSTATQPLLGEVDAAKGALRLTPTNEIAGDSRVLHQQLRRVTVEDGRRAGGWSCDDVATLAADTAHDVGSCLVIVNTKSAARDLHRACRAVGVEKLFHLSTSMCAAHRTDVLEAVRPSLAGSEQHGASHGLVCVSTQLIEAGIDIDFGAVIRYSAGLDSIVQAAGRCNRHGRRGEGRVIVVNPAHENLHSLEEIRIAQQAGARVLDEFSRDPSSLDNDLLSPNAIQRYFRYWFFERKHVMDYPVDVGRDDSLLSLLSDNGYSVADFKRRHGRSPTFFWRQAFKSAARAFKAIDSSTDAVLVPYGAQGQDLISRLWTATSPAECWPVMRRAQRFMVNVFPDQLNRLIASDAVHPFAALPEILYLDERYYSETGVTQDAIAELPFYQV